MLTNMKARIISIAKDELDFCSSRTITAELLGEDGSRYQVKWPKVPAIFGIENVYSSKKPWHFKEAWTSSKVGDEVVLVHGGDDEHAYFIPKSKL